MFNKHTKKDRYSIYRYFLPRLLAFITKKSRYIPDVEWSSKSWTHNTFRVYELIFGRRVGIRAELSSLASADADGVVQEITYRFHSIESVFAHAESMVRGLVPRSIPIRITVPMLQINTGAGAFNVPASPYLFAIAHDANSEKTETNSSLTIAHTCTGSDRALICTAESSKVNVGANATSGIDYDSVAMSLIEDVFESGDSYTGGDSRYCSIWQLVAPSTGADNLVLTSVASILGNVVVNMSFTGVDQGTPIGATNNAGSTTDDPSTLALTTTRAGSMIVDVTCINGTNDATPTNGTKAGQITLTDTGHSIASTYRVCTTIASYDQIWTFAGGDPAHEQIIAEVMALLATGPASLKTYNTAVKA